MGPGIKQEWGLSITVIRCLLVQVFTCSVAQAAPMASYSVYEQLLRDATQIQDNIRIMKSIRVEPLMTKYKLERYGNDLNTISDLDKWAATSYSKEVKQLPEVSLNNELESELFTLLRQTHENLGWTVLWMRHIASQEALHERGLNYREHMLAIEAEARQLMLRVENMAVNNGMKLELQLQNMRFDDAPEFRNTSFRRHHHYIQLYHCGMLLNQMNERFLALESQVRSHWR